MLLEQLLLWLAYKLHLLSLLRVYQNLVQRDLCRKEIRLSGQVTGAVQLHRARHQAESEKPGLGWQLQMAMIMNTEHHYSELQVSEYQLLEDSRGVGGGDQQNDSTKP